MQLGPRGCGVLERQESSGGGDIAPLFLSSTRQVTGYNTARWDLARKNPSRERKEKEEAFFAVTPAAAGVNSIPASHQPSPCSAGHGAGGNPAALPGPTAAPHPGTSDTGKISAPGKGSVWW